MKKIIVIFLLLHYLTTMSMQPAYTILPMGMGVMQINFSPFSNEERVQRIVTTIRQLLNYAQERNNNEKILINTAFIYGMNKGDSERLLSQALNILTPSEHKQLIVATWIGLEDIAIETEKPNHELVGPESMYSNDAYTQFINGSVKNLKMDTFQDIEFWVGLHRVNPNLSIEEQAKQLTMIASHPRVTKVGLSEISLPTLKQFIKHNITIGFLEIELSLSRQFTLKNKLIDFCHDHNILVLAYSPLDRGIWTSKVNNLKDWLAIGKTHPFLNLLPSWNTESIVRANFKQRSKAVNLAHKYNMELNQLALAWIMKHGVIPIPDSTNPGRSASNFKALELINQLNADDMTILNKIKFKGKRYK